MAMITRTRSLKLTLAYIVMAVALVWTFFPLYCALGAAAVLCLAVSWSEFLFALISDEARVRTAPLAVASLMTKDGIQFQWVGSHLLLVLVPPMLLALGARRFVVRAVSLGLVRE